MWKESFSNTLSCVVMAAIGIFGTTLVRGQGQTVPRESVESLRGLLMRNQSDYWVGIFCTRVPAVLRSHLELDRDEGLVIRRVIQESPADKADLRVHDVVLRFGDTDVTNVSDLIAAIDDTRDKETVVVLIRNGQKITLVVTPEKRLVPRSELGSPNFDSDQIMEWIDEFYGNGSDDNLGGFRFRFFHPGKTSDTDSKNADGAKFNLSKDLNITIKPGEGEIPVIRVEKDGETWEFTADDFADLPHGLAPFVEQFLGPIDHLDDDAHGDVAQPDLPDIQFEDEADVKPLQKTSGQPRALEKRIENLERMLYDLRDEFRKMKVDRTNKTDPEST